MTLALVRDDLDLQTPALGTAAAQLALADALVYQLLDVALQAATKVFVQRAAAGQDDVLVQAAAHVDGRRLDDLVDDNGERGQEVGRVDLRVEEDLRSQEALVTDIHRNLAPSRLDHGVLKEVAAVAVVLGELLDDVGRDVAVVLLDFLGRLEGRVRLAAVAQQRLHEVGDVTACDRDRLN